VHEEISGESVLYFDANMPDELAELLWRFEQDGAPRRGGQFEWLAWEESVRQMVELAL
jgi:alpha-1,2-rhamnosyltransferase